MACLSHISSKFIPCKILHEVLSPRASLRHVHCQLFRAEDVCDAGSPDGHPSSTLRAHRSYTRSFTPLNSCGDCISRSRSAGLEDRQHQYVRYAGQMEARKVEDGWLMSESEAAYERVYGATGGPGFNTNNCLPQQVQLNITSAPAEFCLPMKNDRQFKPHFQVQVCSRGSDLRHTAIVQGGASACA